MSPGGAAAQPDSAFETLLEYLYQSHGFDFTGYKRTSLMRRVRKRVDELHLGGYEEYLDYLQVHPEEFGVLFDTILINVTAFYRDPAAWQYMQQSVIPRMARAKSADEPLRVWSAGCASGEEAYTLAMVMAETLGAEVFKQRVKIYATDVDEEALQRARQGIYSAKELQGVPAEQREKYFTPYNGRFAFRADMRRSVIFGRHDLVQDAPISRLDLMVTRNTLMYFTADAQKRILARLHYALNDSGFLFLGRAEMLLTHGDLFTPLDLRNRVFVKVPRSGVRDGLLMMASERTERDVDGPQVQRTRLRDLALDAAPVAQVALDSHGTVVVVNQAARQLFGLGPKDVGRRLQDLELSYRPIELRSRVEQAQQEQRPVLVEGVDRQLPDGHTQHLDIVVTPFYDAEGGYVGADVAFVDVTSAQMLRLELERSRQDLETAYEELQSTNEELETTNEELQSTVEELETTNEELQSANEELETMNEELQSTNGELQTINVELRERSDELDRLNGFMESVLTSLRVGVAVVDESLRVQIWNGRAEDLWGLRADEVVGHSLIGLDIGLPVAELAAPLQRCLRGETDGEDTELRALNRRGRTIACRVTLTPLVGRRGERQGAVVLMEDMGEAAVPAK